MRRRKDNEREGLRKREKNMNGRRNITNKEGQHRGASAQKKKTWGARAANIHINTRESTWRVGREKV
jgi:hypothetical protein